MGVEQRVGPVGRDQFARGHRSGQPPVVGMAGDLENPAGLRPGNPVDGDSRTSRWITLLADWPGTDRPPHGAGPRPPAAAVRSACASPRSAFSATVVPALTPSSTSAAFIQFVRHDSLSRSPPRSASSAGPAHVASDVHDVVAEFIGLELGHEVPRVDEASSPPDRNQPGGSPVAERSRPAGLRRRLPTSGTSLRKPQDQEPHTSCTVGQKGCILHLMQRAHSS
jgi:hypothetical protein